MKNKPTPSKEAILAGSKIRETSEPFVYGARRHQRHAHRRPYQYVTQVYNGAMP